MSVYAGFLKSLSRIVEFFVNYVFCLALSDNNKKNFL